MHIKQVWRATLILTACLWAGLITPAAAQLFGINLGTAPAASAAPQAAPGQPLVLKKYTKRRSRPARQSRATSRKKTHQALKAPAARPASDRRPTGEKPAPEVAGNVTEDTAKPDTARTSAWPALAPSVANARAELGGGTADAGTAFDATPAAPKAIDAPAPTAPTDAAPAPIAAAPTTAPPAATPGTTPPAAASIPTARNGAQDVASAAPETVRLMSAAVQSNETASNSDTAWSRTSIVGKIFVAFGGLLMLASAARLYIG